MKSTAVLFLILAISSVSSASDNQLSRYKTRDFFDLFFANFDRSVTHNWTKFPRLGVEASSFRNHQAKSIDAAGNRDFVEVPSGLQLRHALRTSLANSYQLPDWGKIHLGPKFKVRNSSRFQEAWDDGNLTAHTRYVGQRNDGIWVTAVRVSSPIDPASLLQLELWSRGYLKIRMGFMEDEQGNKYLAQNFEPLFDDTAFPTDEGWTFRWRPLEKESTDNFNLEELKEILYKVSELKGLGLFNSDFLESRTTPLEFPKSAIQFFRDGNGKLQLFINRFESVIPDILNGTTRFHADSFYNLTWWQEESDVRRAALDEQLIFAYFQGASEDTKQKFWDWLMETKRYYFAFRIIDFSIQDTYSDASKSEFRALNVSGFTSRRALKYHAKKHLAEFLSLLKVDARRHIENPLETYEQLATEFWRDSSPTQFILKRPDQSLIKFDSHTNEFSISDGKGKIISYYILEPSYSGIDQPSYVIRETVESKHIKNCQDAL